MCHTVPFYPNQDSAFPRNKSTKQISDRRGFDSKSLLWGDLERGVEDEDNDEFEDDSKSLSVASKAETDPLRPAQDPGNRLDPAGHP